MSEGAGVPQSVETSDEGRLLERHRDGDRDAFGELVARYQAPIYSYLTRTGVVGADRDDLFQDIFMKVHRSAARYSSDRPLHPWVFTIVANTVRNHYRRRRVRQIMQAAAPEHEPADPAPDGARVLEGRESAAWLEGEIARLPREQREVLLLVSVEGLALKSVASSLAIPLNTVKTRLRRARLALARSRARLHPDREGEVFQ